MVVTVRKYKLGKNDKLLYSLEMKMTETSVYIITPETENNERPDNH